MAVDVGSAVGYLDLDISGFLRGLKSAQSEADSASKSIAAKIGKNLSSVGKSLTSAGSTLTKTVTVPVVGAGAAIVKMSSTFESAMSKVQAISGATGDDLVALNKKAQELGATTVFSASEVANGMTEMAKAGWNSQQIIAGMEGVLNAASASGENLASVSTIVADAVTGFGMEAKDATRIADLLTQAANAGTIDINDLGESFKYIAPIASSMGFNIEEVTTAISAMSMAGIKGSQAGTSLRTMLARMVKPTDKVAEAMDELGINITNDDGSFKSLNKIVAEMRGTFSGLTDDQKAYYATTLAGQEGMSGLLSLLNLTQEEYDEIAASMENAGGVAKETADVMLNNLTGQITILKSALEGLAIQFGEIILPYLKRFVEWVQKLVEKFQALNPEQKEQIVKWAGIAAAIGPALFAIGKISTGIGGLFTAFSKLSGGFKAVAAGGKAGAGVLSKLGGALAGITGQIAAVVAVVAVLAAAFVNLWKNNEEFRNKIIAIWDEVKAKFEEFGQGIVDRLNALGFDFENIVEVLKALWDGFCNFLAPVFEGAFNIVSSVLGTVLDVITGILDVFIGLFTGNWEQLWTGIKEIFIGVWNGIIGVLQSLGNTLIGVFDTICGWFGTTWEETWSSIKEFFVGVWESISTWFSETIDNISTFFIEKWEAISTFFSGLWEGITSFVSNAWETIKNVVQVGIMFIGEVISAAWQIITLPFRFIWENCKETIISIWNAIKSTVLTTLDAIQTTISNVWNAVKNFFVTIWTSISTFVSTIWNSIKNTITTVINAISSIISSVFNAIKITVTNIWNSIKDTIASIIDSINTTITNVFNTVKTTVTNIWNGIKNAITTPINAAKSIISSIVDTIKSKISSGFNAAKDTVSNVFNSIKNSISNVMNSAKSIVQGAIEKIKGFFNFSWSLPKLKLPHFSISGKFSLDPPSVPKFSVDWYKKAMNGGMILNGATIFGMDNKGNLLGGGEAGSETVVGTKSLLRMIKRAVYEAIGPLVEASRELAKASAELGYVTYNGFLKLKEPKERYYKTTTDNGGNGDTFVFYSPKAIDEIEAAKQMKKTKRELAEGF